MYENKDVEDSRRYRERPMEGKWKVKQESTAYTR